MTDDWADRVTEKLRNPKRPAVDGLDEYIHRVVASAPPLTAEQIAKISALLEGNDAR